MANTELTRAELDEFWAAWLEDNRVAERNRDWKPLADWYAEDATYGWMLTPEDHFMAVNRDEIREVALGIEMNGLDGWRYDYLSTVVDERNAMIVGFWQQASGIYSDDGSEYVIDGLGGSWFGVARLDTGADAGQLKFIWQRDWFDFSSARHTFTTLLKSGKAPQPLQDRLAQTGPLPLHYRKRDLPSTVWPPPVARGDFVTQEQL